MTEDEVPADQAREDLRDPGANDGDDAADERDAVATGRDKAAHDRDVAADNAGDGGRAAENHRLAAEDRRAAAVDRREAASRATAALTRDHAAEARDAPSSHRGFEEAAGDRAGAALDRAAAALDRESSASDRHDAADRLRNAYRDELTGLLLRDPGRDQLSQSVDRAHRSGEALVFAFLDVDKLKRVNDVDGHAAGDDVLREVGLAIRQNLRSYDIAVRYGGDEFVCALPGAALDDAAQRLQDVTRQLSAAVADAKVSFGLAQLRPEETLEQVLARADADMYARREARGRPAGAE